MGKVFQPERRYVPVAADSGCPFCRIVVDAERRQVRLGRQPPQHVGSALILSAWDDAVAFPPLWPVTSGHLLVVPTDHVQHAGIDPEITGRMFEHASELAWELYLSKGTGANLITSAGASATQTVSHLHVHIVPRRKDDGLKLPWSDQGT
jgi:histidine triad (HIT) family protein